MPSADKTRNKRFSVRLEETSVDDINPPKGGKSQAIRMHAVQFYWTVTKLFGLKYLHGKERELFHRYTADTRPVISFCIVILWFFEKLSGHQVVSAARYNLEPIGHLALDFDCFFKRRILMGLKNKVIIVMATDAVANKELLRLWKAYATFVCSPWLARLVANARDKTACVSDRSLTTFGVVMHGASDAYRIQAEWADRPPLLTLPPKITALGTAALRNLGVPSGSWYVCFHNRESGYAPEYEWANSFRNGDIKTFDLAMAEIAALGGYSIRMGDRTMEPLPVLQNVIDYAHSASKCDWMDLFLCATCDFFIGTSSGLYCLAGVFGRPTAQVNVAPIGCVYSQFPKDLSIPKLVEDSSGQLLSFEALLSDEASSFRATHQFVDRGLQIRDNTREEIRDVLLEILARRDNLDQKGRSQVENDDQIKFRNLMTREHYSFFAKSSVSAAFLKRHRDLLH